MTLLIRRYRESPDLGGGSFEVLDEPHPEVLADLCRRDDAALVALHNRAAEPRTVPLVRDGCTAAHRLEDLLCDGTTPLSDKGEAELPLEGYGYRWLRIVAESSRRLP